MAAKRRLALFPAGTIVRDPHHRESPTRREQDKLSIASVSLLSTLLPTLFGHAICLKFKNIRYIQR